MPTPVIAVPATLTLQQKLDRFIEDALVHNKDGLAPQFIQIMEDLTDRVISLFLLEPAEIARFSPMMMKVMTFTANLSSKTSSSLTGQLYKKASKEQFHQIAEFFKRILWWEPNNDIHGYITTPVTAQFANDFRALANECKAGNSGAQRQQAKALCNTFAETIIDDLFLAPSEYIDIGIVMRKVLTLGVDGVKKAIYEMVNRIVKDVDDKQMLEFVLHYEKMITHKP